MYPAERIGRIVTSLEGTVGKIIIPDPCLELGNLTPIGFEFTTITTPPAVALSEIPGDVDFERLATENATQLGGSGNEAFGNQVAQAVNEGGTAMDVLRTGSEVRVLKRWVRDVASETYVEEEIPQSKVPNKFDIDRMPCLPPRRRSLVRL
jgi:hypothetical protein